jgi:hypothetical protein
MGEEDRRGNGFASLTEIPIRREGKEIGLRYGEEAGCLANRGNGSTDAPGWADSTVEASSNDTPEAVVTEGSSYRTKAKETSVRLRSIGLLMMERRRRLTMSRNRIVWTACLCLPIVGSTFEGSWYRKEGVDRMNVGDFVEAELAKVERLAGQT